MVSAAEKTTQTLATIPSLDIAVGRFVAIGADGSMQVDFGSGAVACLAGGTFAPNPGDSVRCLATSAGTVVLGLSRPRRSTGTVKSLAAPLVTVTTSIGDVAMPYLSSYAPVVGHLVAINWTAGGIVLGQVTAAPDGITPGPGPGPTPPADYSVDFISADSGSYGTSWFTNDVYCSASNIGAWFYGTTIADTIPDAALILSVSVYVTEFYNQFPSSLATIGTHPLTGKAGVPVVSNAITISAGTGWKSLPASFGDLLKTGAAKGVGTNHGGYHKFTARASDSSSGLLRIAWRV